MKFDETQSYRPVRHGGPVEPPNPQNQRRFLGSPAETCSEQAAGCFANLLTGHELKQRHENLNKVVRLLFFHVSSVFN